MLNKFLVVLNIFWAFNLNAQNQLPLANGNFEDTDSDNIIEIVQVLNSSEEGDSSSD